MSDLWWIAGIAAAVLLVIAIDRVERRLEHERDDAAEARLRRELQRLQRQEDEL